MLIGRATKYGTGIEICGDYYDLNTLHEMIWTMADNTREGSPANIMILNFAYEIRKALENQREIVEMSEMAGGESLQYKSCKLFWADFIVGVNLLREQASYLDTDKNQQSILYRLEYIGVKAMIEYDNKLGTELSKWITHFTPYHDLPVNVIVPEIDVCQMNERNGKSRFKKLLDQMQLLNRFSPQGNLYMSELEKQAKELGCEISQLRLPDEAWNITTWKW